MTPTQMADVMEYVAQQLRAGRWSLSAVEVYEERWGAGLFVIFRAREGKGMTTETLSPWLLERPTQWKDRLEQMHRTLWPHGVSRG